MNAKDNTGFTPLFYAVTKNNKELINLLLEHGVKINETDNGPLYLAVESNSPDSAEGLMKHGADSNQKSNYGLTPLEAIKYVRNSTIRMKQFLMK